jgi:hypothetical protein
MMVPTNTQCGVLRYWVICSEYLQEPRCVVGLAVLYQPDPMGVWISAWVWVEEAVL